MKSDEIRSRFLKFFEKREHAITPSASLVPENDPSVLFNTAGMQPLVPYLLGQTHPMGKRIADVQKCVRTGDLDDIGDHRHFSFFEMLGNWSLGDYFKQEALTWSYEFLTSKDEGLGLDPKRLYVTIFEGDENAPYDEESKQIWMSLGIPEDRIYALPADDNWWSPGDNGPCGPCSEMFYDMDGSVGDLDKAGFLKNTKEEKVIEIWNDVFMEYEKKDGKVIGKLSQKNVDTGAGLERMTAVMQGKSTAYDTDLFEGLMSKLSRTWSENPIEGAKDEDRFGYNKNLKSRRIIADHIRAATFMVADGVVPSNSERGYVLRRLLRRAIVLSRDINFQQSLHSLVGVVTDKYKDVYPDMFVKKELIEKVINEEENKFYETLENGLKEFHKGTDPFVLFTTYGFPIELTLELANEKGIKIDLDDFNRRMEEHKKLSQTASAGMFKGGLANHNDKTIKLHTAHHLLLASLQEMFGKDVKQKGSNITEERLRIDFSFDRKITDEEKKKLEEMVNQKITENLPMTRVEMSRDEAERIGAQMEFGAKYPDMVSVYYIGDSLENAFSKEFCGGPHVKNTSELGTFKIQKEEAVASGIRRIKAVLV